MRSQVIFRSHDPRQDVFSLSIDGLPRLERFGSPSQSGNLPVLGVFSTTPRIDAPERKSDFVFTGMFERSYQLIVYREGKGSVAEILKSMARRNDSDLVT